MEHIVFMPVFFFYVGISTVQPLYLIRWKHAWMFLEIALNEVQVQKIRFEKISFVNGWLEAENNNSIERKQCFHF